MCSFWVCGYFVCFVGLPVAMDLCRPSFLVFLDFFLYFLFFFCGKKKKKCSSNFRCRRGEIFGALHTEIAFFPLTISRRRRRRFSFCPFGLRQEREQEQEQLSRDRWKREAKLTTDSRTRIAIRILAWIWTKNQDHRKVTRQSSARPQTFGHDFRFCETTIFFSLPALPASSIFCGFFFCFLSRRQSVSQR